MHIEPLRRVRVTVWCVQCNVIESQILDAGPDDSDESIRRRGLLLVWEHPWRHSPLADFRDPAPLVCSPGCLNDLLDRERERAYPASTVTAK